MFFIRLDNDTLIPSTRLDEVSIIENRRRVAIYWGGAEGGMRRITTNHPEKLFDALTDAFAKAELYSRIRFSTSDSDRYKLHNSDDNYMIVNVAQIAANAEIEADGQK